MLNQLFKFETFFRPFKKEIILNIISRITEILNKIILISLKVQNLNFESTLLFKKNNFKDFIKI